jgi:hypothetical protein
VSFPRRVGKRGQTNKRLPSPWITGGDDFTFPPDSSLPPHFLHWRFPNPDHFSISPAGHENALAISPSKLNLTALNGNYAGPTGQAFVSRPQQDTLFTYSVVVPRTLHDEAGVSAFLTQNHHLDLGVVMLPASARTASFPGERDPDTKSPDDLIPHFRFRGMSYVPVPADVVMPVPKAWVGNPLRMEIGAKNMTHYSFSVGPADAMSEMQTVIDVSNEPVSWGFTGKPVFISSSAPPSLFLTRNRRAPWSVCDEQWRHWLHPCLCFRMEIPATGPIPELKRGHYPMNLYQARPFTPEAPLAWREG